MRDNICAPRIRRTIARGPQREYYFKLHSYAFSSGFAPYYPAGGSEERAIEAHLRALYFTTDYSRSLAARFCHLFTITVISRSRDRILLLLSARLLLLLCRCLFMRCAPLEWQCCSSFFLAREREEIIYTPLRSGLIFRAIIASFRFCFVSTRPRCVILAQVAQRFRWL